MKMVTYRSGWLKYIIFVSVLFFTSMYFIYLFKKVDVNDINYTLDDNLDGVKKHAKHSTLDFHAKNTKLTTSGVSVQVVDVALTFANVKENESFKSKFRDCVTSLLNYTSVSLNLHLITDEASKHYAKNIIDSSLVKSDVHKRKLFLNISTYDIRDIIADIDNIVRVLRDHFSYKSGDYYSDVLFFLSPGLHRVKPFMNIEKLIIIDIDLRFMFDIKGLRNEFDKFSPDMLLGLAYEQQPVYRHLLGSYRRENKGTVIGDPPSTGYPGYNSGIVLMDLDKMRNSKIYESFLNFKFITELVAKFKFKGHLGDQDFYTLLSFEYPQLFHTLSCGWNRQLCQWWKHNGYNDVFNLYNSCNEDVKIYHGNCNTLIQVS